MMEQNRYNDRMKWHQLYRIRASWGVQSGNVPHIIKLLSLWLAKSIAKWLPFFLFHFKHSSKGRYCLTHLVYWHRHYYRHNPNSRRQRLSLKAVINTSWQWGEREENKRKRQKRRRIYAATIQGLLHICKEKKRRGFSFCFCFALFSKVIWRSPNILTAIIRHSL